MPTQSSWIFLDRECKESLSRVIYKALNDVQLLILKYVAENLDRSCSSLLKFISEVENIPLSTLKLNARVLQDLGLIIYGGGRTARLTSAGMIVVFLCQKSSGGSDERI